MLPADHHIEDEEAFARAVATAAAQASAGKLVAFGVPATEPHTGYGYIRARRPEADRTGTTPVERFIGKPDRNTAEKLAREGAWHWNSGMFLFSAKRYLDELDAHAPGLCDAVRAAHRDAIRQNGRVHLGQSFSEAPDTSIDRAVMERTAHAVMIALDAGWADLGTWRAVAERCETDASGNAAQGNVALKRVRNSLVRAESRPVAVIGVSDVVVVESGEGVLVAHRESADEVAQMAQALAEAEQGASAHSMVHPWGSYDVLHAEPGVKVKRLTVAPGHKLSLQSHRLRTEHWTVTRGQGRVTLDGHTFTLARHASAVIPAGARHRLDNAGPGPLTIIEAQTGTHLGEDDIVRYEDAYGRTERR